MSIVASSLLFQPTTVLKWRRHPSPPPPSFPPNSLHLITPTTTSLSKLKLRCFYSPQSNPNRNPNISPKPKLNPNPLQAIVEELLNSIKALIRPTLMAALLAAMVLISDPGLAASGGRMGGSSFSSRSRSSSSGGGGYSSSSGGRSYSSSSYSSSYSSSPSKIYSSSPSKSYSSSSSSSNLSETDKQVILWGIIGVAIVIVIIMAWQSESSVEKTSILKLQVGLLGSGRIIQKEFDRIALTAYTSTPKGLSDLLTEAALALLRNPEYCISAHSSVYIKRSISDTEKSFNELSIEERGKFDEETLVNVNGKRKRSSRSQKSNGSQNEYIVVTILVAAEGVYTSLNIASSGDLNKALQKIAAIASKGIMAVEVLWTPQMENDTLSVKELLENYPLLKPF